MEEKHQDSGAGLPEIDLAAAAKPQHVPNFNSGAFIRSIPDANDLPQSDVPYPDEGLDPYTPTPEEEAKQHQDAMRLLGLNRRYKTFDAETIERYLPTKEKRKAFNSIDTSTNPRRLKIEQKQGIVSEILQEGLLPAELLRNNPTVYLGSGTDIEYPLALGCRETIMVDYIFEDYKAGERVVERIMDMVDRVTVHRSPETMLIDRIEFPFDFGEGREDVVVRLEESVYNPPKGGPVSLENVPQFKPPEKIGLILGFAAQGPSGVIELEDELKAKLAEGGMILDDDVLTSYDQNTKTESVHRLGEET